MPPPTLSLLKLPQAPAPGLVRQSPPRPPFAIAGFSRGHPCKTRRGRPGDRGFIAEAGAGGAPAGAGWFRLFPAADRGYGYVADDIPEIILAILPAFRGQGIGTSLLYHLIDQAQQDGYCGISLSVDPRNAAVRLYERTGFQYVRTDDGGSWTMRKRLQ
jgi:GNAT superfamily N-acetyltransferase